MTNVPFLDLKAQHQSVQNEIAAAIAAVMDRSAFAGGPFAEQFETEFAEFCHCRYAVGVGSGTEALGLTLLTLGIGRGDEVITVPNTFIATAEAISFCGATPVFTDIDEATHTLNPRLLKAAITPRTRAIIPVHIFGQPADMDPILEIARAYRLFVVEDACQAHGAEYKGRRTGSLGDAGCFSFYPGKNLGACGEAGAVVTDQADIAAKIRMLRDHGQSEKYRHHLVGWNARMDGIQGAVLSVKLKHLEKWNAARRANAGFYRELLGNRAGLLLPGEAEYARHVYHIYAVRVQNRDALISALAEDGIFCGIHYPVPIHLTEAYQGLGYGRGSFPVAEKCAEELVSLPMFPELRKEQIEQVADELMRAADCRQEAL
ncbi:erythromycin biosynthesis sensory transduction p rotein eryC1 [Desulfonema ishimotonii]|uniref:Erythromycin biosynthesis sensory transduction p rotein eryC1 n=1 Tax=Desulfonema ishimotonii TaxID=45657 RepID=A0A401G3L7_9BACT|nr:DegT/DnrJ/EryC1/StrS family aminotransferase [Desulfonema ishimotonii]GBC63771.1 erythromycin biosynthesis sensory transduction p rotein eryC1 [Desulfonema ishimotonii]